MSAETWLASYAKAEGEFEAAKEVARGEGLDDPDHSAFETWEDQLRSLATDAQPMMEALAGFIDVFKDGMLAMHVGETLTCHELDTLADLFMAAGEAEAAADWIAAHAGGDDEGDRHYLGEAS